MCKEIKRKTKKKKKNLVCFGNKKNLIKTKTKKNYY